MSSSTPPAATETRVMTYEEIMSMTADSSNSSSNGSNAVGSTSTSTTTNTTTATLTTNIDSSTIATKALGYRLQLFRKWLQNDANVTVHPSICIVNGEATDGTKNAPVLILEKPKLTSSSTTTIVSSSSSTAAAAASLANGGIDKLDHFNQNQMNGNGNSSNDMDSTTTTTTTTVKKVSSIFEGRVGMIDHYYYDNDDSVTAATTTTASSSNSATRNIAASAFLYDRTMGCQIRTIREMKINDTMMIIPKNSMITPDLVAASDAGKAVFACCLPKSKTDDILTTTITTTTSSIWDRLENTTIATTQCLNKIVRHSGTQTLVKILQERKRAEQAYQQRLLVQQQQQQSSSSSAFVDTNHTTTTTANATTVQLAEFGSISTRAPFLLFLIHQRFYNTIHVPVSSPQYVDTTTAVSDNAQQQQQEIQIPSGSPSTFAPYARTLPTSVSIPLCWKRNELAMLSSCIPGIPILHDVAANTMQLVSEFIALLHAGILERFPNTFPPGLITWDRYVWAAAVFASRNLPATSYYHRIKDEEDGKNASQPIQLHNELQSPTEIWDELGVLIPLLDMLNHEVEDHQVTWEPTTSSSRAITMNDSATDDDKMQQQHPKAIIHKKVKKGAEIYCCYGSSLSNTNLILQYGFAQINNISDEVRLGWAIFDAVGNVNPPTDFIPPSTYPKIPSKYYIYESNDDTAITAWWTPDRMSLLQEEACCSDPSLINNLKLKKKMSVTAYNDGRFNPILLSAIVVATMSETDVQDWISSSSKDEKSKRTIVLSKRHQKSIQCYLQFTFIRKLEKLLQNLNNGLSDFYPNLKLWTKCTSGGLNYDPTKKSDNSDESNKHTLNGNSGSSDFIGWQSFFDRHAYKAAMKVESRYYAMGTESCVLTMYDGQLRALQLSLDTVLESTQFESIVLKQLEELGYDLSMVDDNEGDEDLNDNKQEVIDIVDDDSGDVIEIDNVPQEEATQVPESNHINNSTTTSDKKSPRNRKRNRKRNNNNHTNGSQNNGRVPTLKLHVGNLSFTTKPADLFDYFSSIYGRDNIMECHIPVERDNGKSRGFGFVVMPEAIAEELLQLGKKFEMNGRVLKVARSSSASTGGNAKVSNGPTQPPPPPVTGTSERCLTCGYRPKYCTCPRPNIQGIQHPSSIPNDISTTSRRLSDPMLHRDFGPPNGYYRDDDYRNRDYWDGRDRSRDYDRDRRYNSRYDGDDEYRRGRYDRDEDYYYRDHSRRSQEPRDNYHHERDRSPHDSRSRSSSHRREHEDTNHRSSSSSHRRGRDDDDEDSKNTDRNRKRSRSKEKSSRRKKNKRRHRSRSSGSSDSPHSR